MFQSMVRRKERRRAVHATYGRIVERARDPIFHLDWHVPDTLDGRFELLALHVFLVLNRLKREEDAAPAFAQRLFDMMFADLDRALREMGASDLGVGRRVKEMASAFYGRVAAYDGGLGDKVSLPVGLRRNLFGTVSPGEAEIAVAVDYVTRQVAALAAQPIGDLLAGQIRFAPVTVR